MNDAQTRRETVTQDAEMIWAWLRVVFDEFDFTDRERELLLGPLLRDPESPGFCHSKLSRVFAGEKCYITLWREDTLHNIFIWAPHRENRWHKQMVEEVVRKLKESSSQTPQRLIQVRWTDPKAWLVSKGQQPFT